MSVVSFRKYSPLHRSSVHVYKTYWQGGVKCVEYIFAGQQFCKTYDQVFRPHVGRSEKKSFIEKLFGF